MESLLWFLVCVALTAGIVWFDNAVPRRVRVGLVVGFAVLTVGIALNSQPVIWVGAVAWVVGLLIDVAYAKLGRARRPS